MWDRQTGTQQFWLWADSQESRISGIWVWASPTREQIAAAVTVREAKAGLHYNHVPPTTFSSSFLLPPSTCIGFHVYLVLSWECLARGTLKTCPAQQGGKGEDMGGMRRGSEPHSVLRALIGPWRLPSFSRWGTAFPKRTHAWFRSFLTFYYPKAFISLKRKSHSAFQWPSLIGSPAFYTQEKREPSGDMAGELGGLDTPIIPLEHRAIISSF